MPATAVQLETRASGRFSSGALLIVCCYGLLLIIPVVMAMLLVSLLHFGIWTFLIPLGTICVVTYFLPFGFGNRYVTRLVSSLDSGESDGTAFVVQLTFHPRARSGLRALVEDADDIGQLMVSEKGLVFMGDSMRLSIPRDQILNTRIQSIGFRGLFVYPRIVLALSGLPQIRELRFADRSAWVLPTARKRTRELYELLTGQTCCPPRS